MSCSHDHNEALAEAKRDPTRTTTLRKRYASALRSEFAAISAALREGVRTRDVLGLRAEALADAPPRFEFSTTHKKVEAFERWLREQQRKGVLTVISRNGNTYIRSAYGSGLQHAARELRNAGIETTASAGGIAAGGAELSAVFNRPIHRDALELLYTRNYQQLQGVTDAVAQQIARELTQGFAEGVSPTEMARRLTDRIDKVGKTRATVLARTEVINAHAEATLNRFERMGVEQVGAQVEWLTAGDSRVCSICASLEGNTYSLAEARGKLPAHPQCRCAWIPLPSMEAAAAYMAHPKEYVALQERGVVQRWGSEQFETLADASADRAEALAAVA